MRDYKLETEKRVAFIKEKMAEAVDITGYLMYKYS